MDLREIYQNSPDKIDYFETLSKEEKQELYQQLSIGEQKELLSILPFQYIKEFISTYEIEKQGDIYQRLNDSQLTAIYNTSSQEEKQSMIQAIETRQIKLNETVNRSNQEINKSSSVIAKSTQEIEKSHQNIAINKENIKESRHELKQNKIILKKLNKERKKKLKQVMRAKKSISPLRKTNRIGFISKYRTKKYLEKIESLQQIEININDQRMTNEQIQQQINTFNKIIEKEQKNIEKQESRIEKEQANINRNVSRIDRTEKQIKKLSKEEKKLLGRKLYNQTVFARDCIIVRKKKETKVAKKEEQPAPIATPKVEVIDPKDVSIEPAQKNTQETVNTVMNNANRLQEMGVNFYPPANRINNTQNEDLLKSPMMQITPEQLILMSYTMMAVYNYALQQMMLQQNREQQSLSNGHTRTLSPNNRGVVNVTLLMSIILFIFSLFLFFIK